MKAIILGLTFFLLLVNELFAQIDGTLQEILIKSFEDERCSEKVFTGKYGSKNAIYLFSNKELRQYISNYEELSIRIFKNHFVPIFNTKSGPVNIFKNADLLGTVSDFKIDVVVVLDKVTISKKNALISFHTTNLDSKRYGRSSESKFFKFNCSLELYGATWGIKSLEIKNNPFKSIVD